MEGSKIKIHSAARHDGDRAFKSEGPADRGLALAVYGRRGGGRFGG